VIRQEELGQGRCEGIREERWILKDYQLYLDLEALLKEDRCVILIMCFCNHFDFTFQKLTGSFSYLFSFEAWLTVDNF